MDIVSAFNQPVIIMIDNSAVSFIRFSPPEIAAECSRIKAGKVAQARRLANEYGVSGLEALKLVRQAEDEEPTVNALWLECTVPAAALELLTKALKKNGLTPDQSKETLSKIDIDTVIETALKLCGYKIPDTDEKEDTKKKTKKAKEVEEPTGFNR